MLGIELWSFRGKKDEPAGVTRLQVLLREGAKETAFG